LSMQTPAVALLVTVGLILVCGVFAGRANLGLAPKTANDLYGVKWGVALPTTTTATDFGWPFYFDAMKSAPSTAPYFEKFVLTPRALVLGGWWGLNKIEGIVKSYIAKTTGGDPSVGVQFVVDRVRPWECDACNYLPRAEDIACFKNWINAVAKAIGSTRAAITVQPDSWFATCAPNYSNVYKNMIKYAVNTFRKLPHVSVYIDGQSSDWSPYDQVAKLLKEVGVGLKGVRGFTLGQTHMAPEADQYKFGKAVVQELAKKYNIKGRHFIVNRELNGHPVRTHINGKSNPSFSKNIKCSRPGQTNCFAFGRSPYVTKNDPYCDGYLWFGTFGMNPPPASSFRGMVQFSPFGKSLPPSSVDKSDKGYTRLMAAVWQRANSPSNSPLRDEVLRAASYLTDRAGSPDLKNGWYKKGDPKHSTKTQRANTPQKHPCKRTDYGKNAVHGFVWPKCNT